MANNLSPFSKTFLIWDVETVSTITDTLTQPPVAKPVPFNVFASNFSDLPSPSGIISIPVPVYATSADDLSSGPVFTDAQPNNYQLTVNRDAGKFYKWNPAEAQQYGSEYIVKSYILPPIYAIDSTLNSASFALLNSFPTSSVKPATATAMSASTALQFKSAMGNAGINGDQFMVLNTSYFWNGLVNDLSNKGNSVGAAAVTNGSPNNPFGMVTVEGQTLPTAGNLVGFCGNKSAIAIGTAIPNVQHANGEQFVYKSPWTGVNYLVEHYFDESRRANVIGASVLYNVAVVNPAILRIVSS